MACRKAVTTRLTGGCGQPHLRAGVTALARPPARADTWPMAVSAAASAPAQTPAAWLRRIGGEALYLQLGCCMAIVALTVSVTGIALSLSLGLLIIGFPVVLLTFACCRWLAGVERRRAALVLGAPIAAAYRPPPADRRLAARLKAAAHDPQRWKDLAYLVLLGEVGLVCGTIWAVLWGVALGSLTLPAWWWAMPDDALYLWFEIDTFQESIGASAIGVALLPVAVFAQRPLALAQAHLARWLLGPSLAARVERLTETRAGAVDAAAAELQRIERDLHDGAQARLVALAMELGMAEERFDRDPDGARRLVGEARREAKRALAELRDLARGMRPSLLAERGLEPAVTALAARSPVPATATVDVPRRPPAQIETAAWFVVSEALANAAKHSGAERAGIWLTLRDGHLEVEVADDGRGGADPAGAGLKGLAQRVEALDGALEVHSPPGGPTVVRASLPCGS
jgi:signal transduction histidine kinase